MGQPPSSLVVFSSETQTNYQISIVSPDPASHPGPWRVLLALDADDHFPVVLDAYRGLWARGLGRPWLIVGVGYGARFKQPGNHRVRDYTHRAMAWEPGSGGGTAFAHFLEVTLWSRLEAVYPVRRDDPALLGHSLGGLFVLNELFRERPFFQRGVALAPSLWWDEHQTLQMLEARMRDGSPEIGRLFVGVGESDTDSMQDDCRRLEQALRTNTGARPKWSLEWFSGRGHFNVVPVGYAAGLKALV